LKQSFQMALIVLLLLTMIGCSNGSNEAINDEQFDSGPETERVEPLGRGINLGNMLEADQYEGNWGEKIEEAYFTLIKNAGFDTVRIPIRWSIRADQDYPYTINPEFFNRVDQVIGWAKDQDLKIVINMHHYDEIFADPDGHKGRFIEMWRQISERYKNEDPDKFYFELLNEPHDQLTMTKWNSIMNDTIRMLRDEVGITHKLIIAGSDWGGASGLTGLSIPAEELSKRSVIVTFHFYAPFNFTHQGADWVNPTLPTGVAWPGSRISSALKVINDELDIAKSWSENHNNIPLWLGEFGAYSKAPYPSRVKWTAYVRKQAESRGISWAYWEFCAGFGIYDDQTGNWYKELVDALGCQVP
jgi:endoglucanase